MPIFRNRTYALRFRFPKDTIYGGSYELEFRKTRTEAPVVTASTVNGKLVLTQDSSYDYLDLNLSASDTALLSLGTARHELIRKDSGPTRYFSGYVPVEDAPVDA